MTEREEKERKSGRKIDRLKEWKEKAKERG